MWAYRAGEDRSEDNILRSNPHTWPYVETYVNSAVPQGPLECSKTKCLLSYN